MIRGTAAHVVDAQRAVLPQLTEYTEHVSSPDGTTTWAQPKSLQPRRGMLWTRRPGSTKLPQAETRSRRGAAYADLASWITLAIAALGARPRPPAPAVAHPGLPAASPSGHPRQRHRPGRGERARARGNTTAQHRPRLPGLRRPSRPPPLPQMGIAAPP